MGNPRLAGDGLALPLRTLREKSLFAFILLFDTAFQEGYTIAN